MKIGLSLSMCIKDIIEGRVDEDEVTALVTNTRARNDHDWARLKNDYASVFWRAAPDEAFEVVDRLVRNGRIVQPRLDDPDYQHKSDPLWIEVPSQAFGSCDPRQRQKPPRTRIVDVPVWNVCEICTTPEGCFAGKTVCDLGDPMIRNPSTGEWHPATVLLDPCVHHGTEISDPEPDSETTFHKGMSGLVPRENNHAQ